MLNFLKRFISTPTAVPPMPEWDEIVKIMYDKSLDYEHGPEKVIYSKDKAIRYVIYKNSSGFYQYDYEVLEQFDEWEWEMRYSNGGDAIPAYWVPQISQSSTYDTVDTTMKEIMTESDYAVYFA